jgi:hypothetical protein
MSQPLEIYRSMLRAAGVSEAMLRAIEGEVTEKQYVLLLTPYEAANLMQMVRSAYRIHVQQDIPAETPISSFNSGDWIGQIHWKLREEVGDEYPVTPNPIYVPTPTKPRTILEFEAEMSMAKHLVTGDVFTHQIPRQGLRVEFQAGESMTISNGTKIRVDSNGHGWLL